MNFNPKRTCSGAFEEAFEAWLNQAKNDDDVSDVEEDVVLIEPPNHGNNDCASGEDTTSPSSPGESAASYSSPVQQQIKKRQNLVIRQRRSGAVQRFQAYKAVLKKYSRRGWFLRKKSSSPGSQTDDSGVVSPGCDASVGTLKDVMEEGSDVCLSGDDSPPNIQDDFTSANGWASDTLYPQRLDSECLDHPPELIPSQQVAGMPHVLQNQENIKDTQQTGSVDVHECPSTKREKHFSAVRDLMCTSILEKYGSPSKENHRSKSRKRSNSGRWKTLRSTRCHRLESPSQSLVTDNSESCSGVGPKLDKKSEGVCMERALSGSDTSSYMSRNGCEIGASDSGAGSQSESCCEESPRHEHDNLVSSGPTKTKSPPQFSCDSHHFTVIPSDNLNKKSSSGSPPLVLKLKCERKSNVKNSPPKYRAVKAGDSSETKVVKSEPDHVDNKVFHSHSADAHTCSSVAGPQRSKRLKAARKNSAGCPCCVGSKSPARRKRHSRSLSDASVVSFFGKSLVPAQERKFIRQSLHLSNLQTKVHTLFHCLFPRLQPVLSMISPEGRNFTRIIDDVIGLLQQSESEDDVKESEELSGELEHLTLKGDNLVEPVYEPHVVLCRSPWLCLDEFREKVFLLIQLLLPELTLSLENNCYRSQRELEKFLDKIIVQNKTST